MSVYSLQEIVDGIKQDSQAGEVGNNADRTAADILRKFCDARLEFWNANPWDWSKVDIGPIVVPAGSTAVVTLDATIGEVIILGLTGMPGELDSYTEKEYRKWRMLNSTAGNVPTDQISGYVRRGRDATGALRLLFVNPPSSDASVEGEGKLRLNPIRYAVADIATVTQLDYFPDEVQPLLIQLAYGLFLDSIKDARGPGEIAAARQAIETLKGTNRTDPATDAHTHPPDYIRFMNRKRGGRTVA